MQTAGLLAHLSSALEDGRIYVGTAPTPATESPARPAAVEPGRSGLGASSKRLTPLSQLLLRFLELRPGLKKKLG